MVLVRKESHHLLVIFVSGIVMGALRAHGITCGGSKQSACEHDSRAPGCRSWFCHLLAVRCGTRDLTSVLCPLCLGFLNSVEKILPTWES